MSTNAKGRFPHWRKYDSYKKQLVVNESIMDTFRDIGCITCGFHAKRVLCAHHYFGKRFHANHTAMRNKSTFKFVSELSKCVCLCQNCHSLHHADLLPIGPDKYLKFLVNFISRLNSSGQYCGAINLSEQHADSRIANSSKIKISPGLP